METEDHHVPRYKRTNHPPSMYLTERDQLILEAIQAYNGLLSFFQIQRKFFTCKSQAERRMMMLYQHNPDKIAYAFNESQLKRNIRPDGFFMLTTGGHRIRYLLKIDRSTKDNPRFLREKILPGLACVRSKPYEEHFGHHSGPWVVVTMTKSGKRQFTIDCFSSGCFRHGFLSYSVCTVDE